MVNLPNRNCPPPLPNSEILLPNNNVRTIASMPKAPCALPKQPFRLSFDIKNRGLSSQEYNSIINSKTKECTIIYSGNFINFRTLITQLSTIKNLFVNVRIFDVEVDKTIYLPFNTLGNNIRLFFVDTPKDTSNFNAYLVNNPSILNDLLNNIDPMTIDRIKAESDIQDIFSDDLLNLIHKRGKHIHDYSDEQLMDVIFNYVCKNYPYDWSLVDSSGDLRDDCHFIGDTAYSTYTRGKGICTGRSRLIKLYANSKLLQLPCYLVTGMFGNLPHQWNEFIDDRGQIIEYDSSTGKKVILSRLPRIYNVEHHEPAVRKLIKK